MGIQPELEKVLTLLPKKIREKFNKERTGIESTLRKYQWYTNNNKLEQSYCSCGAVDSSFLAIESRVGYIYVIQGAAVLYTMKDGKANRTMFSLLTDAGFINIRPIKDGYVIRKTLFKKVLTEYAYMLELETLLKIVIENKCDVALIDGSFISFAATRYTKDFSVSIESINKSYDLGEIENKKIVYLNKLSRHKHTIFLAKSSNAGFYTKGIYSDMHVLELARIYKLQPYNKPGFLEPLTVKVRPILSKLIKDFEIDIDAFTITYSRFREGLPVYQLTFPYEIDVDSIKNIYLCLKTWSTSGYPIPLEYAHKFSYLPRKPLINAMMLLGIPIATGRELIEL